MSSRVSQVKPPQYHQPREMQHAKASASKYAKYAVGIIVGLGLVAGATYLGIHMGGINAISGTGIAVGGMGGIGALACARLAAQRGRFDRLVSKMKAGKELTAEELRAPLIPGGMTPVQMALHRAEADGNPDFYKVAENVLLANSHISGDLTVSDWDALFSRSNPHSHVGVSEEQFAQNVQSFLNRNPKFTKSARDNVRLAIQGRLVTYDSHIKESASLKRLYVKFGGNVRGLAEQLEARREEADEWARQEEAEQCAYSHWT